MVRAIRCHRQNMKTDITDDSKVSRLSVAIHYYVFIEFRYGALNVKSIKNKVG